jgi:rubrerythrin
MDVLEFAVEMDRRGRDFYRLLARRAARPGARRIFDRMAEEEERMLEGYRRMKAQEPEQRADSTVLQKKDNPFPASVGLSADVDEVAAYRTVVDIERKVCRMLENAAEKETDPSAKGLLRQVAAVECCGLEQVEAVYDFINAPNEYLAWGEFSNLTDFHNFGRYEDNRRCGHTT